jgi:hypothetical protein
MKNFEEVRRKELFERGRRSTGWRLAITKFYGKNGNGTQI